MLRLLLRERELERDSLARFVAGGEREERSEWSSEDEDEREKLRSRPPLRYRLLGEINKNQNQCKI